MAKYTFIEQCVEVQDIYLEDGTTKIFLNMTSKKGSKELVSLLQYMKDTTLENPEVIVKDARIIELDEIVREVKESEEWEAVRMNIMEIAMERGMQQGIEQGMQQGIEQGEKRLNVLYKKLLDDNRQEDLKRSMVDESFRKNLYEEY